MPEQLENTFHEPVVIDGTSPEFERGYRRMQVDSFKSDHPVLGTLVKAYCKLTRQI